MKISFIIATWNCLPQITECLRTLEALWIPESEIIVVDAASKDGTAEFLQNHAGITYRLMPRKLSWSENNNIGISLASGEWLCVMNPDIYFNESFKELLDVLGSFDRQPYPIISPQLVYPDGSEQSDCLLLDFPSIVKHFTLIGAYFERVTTRRRIRGNPFETTPLERRSSMRNGHEIVRMSRGHGRGSLFIVHRSNISLFGGQLWRNNIRMIAADSDMFRMATEKGVAIVSVPSARLVHEEGHATKYQDQTDLYKEISYGLIMYSRYWKEHPRVLTLFLALDTVFAFIIAPVRRKLFRTDVKAPRLTPRTFLKSYRFRMVGKVQGIIEAWSNRLE